MRYLPFLAALVAAPAAPAEWQFARWGMTPEQLVAASGGTAELLPVGKRPRMPPLETAASGEFKDGAMMLRTTFSFGTDGSGLSCVFYGVYSHDDDNAFKTSLVRRYGPPQTTAGLPAIGQDELGWITATDQIKATFSPDDPAFVSHCRRS
jgi:hypothetical protein